LLYTIVEAAVVLGVTRDRIWYAIRNKLWKPRFTVSHVYVLDDQDLKALGKVLKDIGRTKRGRKPSGFKYLADENPDEPKS